VLVRSRERPPNTPPPKPKNKKTALAALCGVGGLVGFAKKKSVPSLVAGVAFAAAYGWSASLIHEGEAERGHCAAAAASALLSAAMGARLVRTRKAMPAGALTALGLGGLAYNWAKYGEYRAVA
jgi:uncharacterized membrane protein (UPF0136 family)